MTFTYAHGQVVTFSLRALYRFGRAMVGVAHGETKAACDDHLDVMKRHIEFVQECIDGIDWAEDDPSHDAAEEKWNR